MNGLLSPRDIVADAIMRMPGTVPSKATYAKTDDALDNLALAGWSLIETEELAGLRAIAERHAAVVERMRGEHTDGHASGKITRNGTDACDTCPAPNHRLSEQSGG